jgi:hypothetical protein
MTSEERNALVAAVRQRYHYFAPFLTEQTRRLWAASEVLTIGRHGTAIVVEATGMAADPLLKGQAALPGGEPPLPEQQRTPGGGRKKLTDTDPTLLSDLDRLIDPATRGAPLITAAAGGSNGYRTRLWKVELQGLADELKLAISVCHFPPGTSKWNKIEHRLFGYISKNWRGRPLDSLATVVNRIASTTTKTGLYVEAALDQGSYLKGIKVPAEAMERLCLKRDKFHGEWNYTLLPRQ